MSNIRDANAIDSSGTRVSPASPEQSRDIDQEGTVVRQVASLRNDGSNGRDRQDGRA